MHDGDDVDILYVLSPHGWSKCILYVDHHTYELSISHVFGDPIRDFIEATIALLKGDSTIEFIGWKEPGGNRWRMTRNLDQKHKVKITVTEFNSPYRKSIAQERTVVEFEIKISHFSATYQLLMIDSLITSCGLNSI